MSGKVMIDLFCGLGGASDPFRAAGWRVIGVDIEARFRPDVVADVRALPLKRFHVDLLWASIPCDGIARAMLPWKYERPEDVDLSPAVATRQLIGELQPQTWIVECSRLSRRFLTPIFGAVRAQTTGHAFWSNRVILIPQINSTKTRMGPHPERAALRARIPGDISRAIFRMEDIRCRSLS